MLKYTWDVFIISIMVYPTLWPLSYNENKKKITEKKAKWQNTWSTKI